MSSPDQFYGQQRQSPAVISRPQSGAFDIDTPPPPPPKPSHQDTSQRASPQQNGPPLPPPPHTSQRTPPTQPTNDNGTRLPSTDPVTLPPPSLEEGWLPAALQDKGTPDLGHILSDNTLLNAFASTHPSYQESLKSLESALSTNTEQVKQVQATENHISRLRGDVQALLLQHTTLWTQWRRKQTEMDAALEPWSPQSMYQRLVASIGEQEALLRAVEESFLDGYGEMGHGATDREVSEWIRRVREGTSLLEKRREARARWDEGRVGGWR